MGDKKNIGKILQPKYDDLVYHSYNAWNKETLESVLLERIKIDTLFLFLKIKEVRIDCNHYIFHLLYDINQCKLITFIFHTKYNKTILKYFNIKISLNENN